MRHVHAHVSRPTTQPRRSWRSEAGEGVISTAIAVLIMALLGAGMWVAFQSIFSNASQRTAEQVELIGG
ncbi:hypothetical protein FTX61_05420 [Nitriliruptoraceae bacterium ZYF776]|nr:hypothetical protein [Profundirhabdus halotolerans]